MQTRLPQQTGPGWFDAWGAQPNSGVLWLFRQIPFAQFQLGDTIQKGWNPAKIFIRRYPAKWHLTVLKQLLQQLQRDLGLGPKLCRRWNTALLPAFGMRAIKPIFRQIQLSRQEGVSARTRQSKIHRNPMKQALFAVFQPQRHR